MRRNRPPFVADAMHCDDSAIFYVKPQDPGIEFPHMAHLKQSIAKRFG
jgi:hypothetical protein